MMHFKIMYLHHSATVAKTSTFHVVFIRVCNQPNEIPMAGLSWVI